MDKKTQHFLDSLRSSSDVEYVGSRWKKLNAFVTNLTAQDQISKASKTVQSLTDNDFFSAQLKLELVNILQDLPTVLNILKSENTRVIPRVIKFAWLYDGPNSIVEAIEPITFVNQWIQHLSYSSRQKVIYRLGLLCTDKVKMDALFLVMKKNYGLESAKNLLPGCTEDTLKSYFVENEKPVVLTSSKHLERIAFAYPTVGLHILKKMCAENQQLLINPTRTIRTLMKLEPSLVLDFLEQLDEKNMRNPVISFSCSETKEMIKKYKSRILKNAGKYAYFLHSETIVRSLNDTEFITFLVSILPKTASQCCDQLKDHYNWGCQKNLVSSWFKLIPEKKRMAMLRQAFATKYGKDIIMDFPESLTFDMVLLLSSEDRELVVKKLKAQAATTDDDDNSDTNFNIFWLIDSNYVANKDAFWASFFPPDETIKCVQKLCNMEPDVYKRSQLVPYLILTCVVHNQDFNALATVLNFVVNRFRNDQMKVRETFLEFLHHFFPMSKLGPQHWKPIIELIQIAILGKEFSRITEKFIVKIITLDEPGVTTIPTNKAVSLLVKLQLLQGYGDGGWLQHFDSCTFSQRKALVMIANELETMYGRGFPSEGEKKQFLEFLVLPLMDKMVTWNRHCNSKNALDFSQFAWMRSTLLQLIEMQAPGRNMRWDCKLEKIVRIFPGTGNAADWERKCILSFKKNPDAPLFKHLMKIAPQLLLNDLPAIIDAILSSHHERRRIFVSLRCQGYVLLCEKIISHCRSIVNKPEGPSMSARQSAMQVLSLLMDSNEFIQEFVVYPTQDRITVDEDFKTELIPAVCLHVGNVCPPSLAFDSLLQFCRGDYLKFTLGSLCSVSMKAGAYKVIPLLKKLVDRPVSVKKHAIRLLSCVANEMEYISFLSQRWAAEKHVTTRQVLFHQLISQFEKNGSPDVWMVIKNAISTLNADDRQCFQELVSINVPAEFLPEFLSTCWEQMRGLLDCDEIVSSACSLLSTIAGMKKSCFPKTIVRKILLEHWLIPGQKRDLQRVNTILATKYLLCSTVEDLEENTDFMTKKFQEFGAMQELQENVCKRLGTFIECLCRMTFNHKLVDLDLKILSSILSKLEVMCTKILPSQFSIVERMHLKLTQILHEDPYQVVRNLSTEADNFSYICEHVCEMTKTFSGQHGTELLHFFATELKRFFSYALTHVFENTDSSVYNPSLFMLLVNLGVAKKAGNDKNCLILAAMLLPSKEEFQSRDLGKELYTKLESQLKKCELEQVQILLCYKNCPSFPHCY